MNLKHALFAATIAGAVATSAIQLAHAQAADNHDLANRLVLQFVMAQNTQNVDLFDGVFPKDYIQHNPDVSPGLDGVKKAFAPMFEKIKAKHVPFKVTIEDVAVDGDRVVLRSLTKYQSKGKWLQARSIDEWRIINGKLGEHWDSDSEPHAADK